MGDAVVLRLPQVASASDAFLPSIAAIASSIAPSCTARQSALPSGSQPAGCSSRRRAITAGQREVARESRALVDFLQRFVDAAEESRVERGDEGAGQPVADRIDARPAGPGGL
jgi:hypothetical protein